MRGAGWRWRAGLLLALLVLGLAGCATMRGLGEDIQSLGRGIKKVFTA
jgi:predicted small secreted protein